MVILSLPFVTLVLKLFVVVVDILVLDLPLFAFELPVLLFLFLFFALALPFVAFLLPPLTLLGELVLVHDGVRAHGLHTNSKGGSTLRIVGTSS